MKHANRWRLGVGLALSAGLLLGPAARAQDEGKVDKKTQRLWKSKCGSCHGEDGKGETQKGKEMKLPDMTTAAYQKRFSDADIKRTIENGIKETKDGVKKEMDPFKDELKPEQLDALVAYIRALAAAK